MNSRVVLLATYQVCFVATTDTGDCTATFIEHDRFYFSLSFFLEVANWRRQPASLPATLSFLLSRVTSLEKGWTVMCTDMNKYDHVLWNQDSTVADLATLENNISSPDVSPSPPVGSLTRSFAVSCALYHTFKISFASQRVCVCVCVYIYILKKSSWICNESKIFILLFLLLLF